MAANDPRQVLMVPGRLISGPTQGALVTGLPLDANGLPTYGGTPFGIKHHARLKIKEESFELTSESTSKLVGVVQGATRFSFEFELVQFDPAVLNQVYAYTTTSAGGFGTTNVLREPSIGAAGGDRPGLQVPGSPLLFAADDPAHPSMLFFAPIYSHGGQKEVDTAAGKLRVEVIEVIAIDDAGGTGHLWACGLIQDLSLT